MHYEHLLVPCMQNAIILVVIRFAARLFPWRGSIPQVSKGPLNGREATWESHRPPSGLFRDPSTFLALSPQVYGCCIRSLSLFLFDLLLGDCSACSADSFVSRTPILSHRNALYNVVVWSSSFNTVVPNQKLGTSIIYIVFNVILFINQSNYVNRNENIRYKSRFKNLTALTIRFWNRGLQNTNQQECVNKYIQ